MDNPSSTRSLKPWLSLVGIILLQSISATNSNFPAYSSKLKQHLSISNVQMNNLIVASDAGRLFDVFSTVAAMNHVPLWLMLIIGLVLGSFSYGFQFLFLVNKISFLSYWQVLFLHFLSGNSISWINTACSVAAVRNFAMDNPSLVALTSTYSGLSGKFYSSMVQGIHHGQGSSHPSTYLLLGILVPIGASAIFSSLVREDSKPAQSAETRSFSVLLFVIATLTGAYALFESVAPAYKHVSPSLRVTMLLSMIMLPLVVPLVMVLQRLIKIKKWNPKVSCDMASGEGESNPKWDIEETRINVAEKEEVENKGGGDEEVIKVVKKIGDEFGVKELVGNVDFWLYFGVYACGATLSMIYFNYLGCISRSRGNSETPFLLAISSSFSFFGRLFTVTLDWFTRGKHMLSRPASMLLMMIPMSASFFLLLNTSNHYLYISTAILGTCSGVITTITVSITSELFGSKNSNINHRIIRANIPIGSLVFGYLAAFNYDRESDGGHGICMGFQCYRKTFIIWGSICSLGAVLSFVLYLRTRKYYQQR